MYSMLTSGYRMFCFGGRGRRKTYKLTAVATLYDKFGKKLLSSYLTLSIQTKHTYADKSRKAAEYSLNNTITKRMLHNAHM